MQETRVRNSLRVRHSDVFQQLKDKYERVHVLIDGSHSRRWPPLIGWKSEALHKPLESQRPVTAPLSTWRFVWEHISVKNLKREKVTHPSFIQTDWQILVCMYSLITDIEPYTSKQHTELMRKIISEFIACVRSLSVIKYYCPSEFFADESNPISIRMALTNSLPLALSFHCIILGHTCSIK